ncbi:MAG: hypothetical protein R3C69_05580 [Geminicoccaceae bacterium]
MREESFGPVVGIRPVAGDDAATRLMNTAPTASPPRPTSRPRRRAGLGG